jgi:hypothetical protein
MNSYDSNAMAGTMMQMMGTILIIVLVAMVFFVICYWKIYTKAGKPGWACIVPIYGTIVLLEIVGKPWWWLFLFFIPFVGLIFAIIMVHNLSLSFGKGAGFTLGLLFLSPIFIPILAFGSAEYKGPGGNDGVVPAFA